MVCNVWLDKDNKFIFENFKKFGFKKLNRLVYSKFHLRMCDY